MKIWIVDIESDNGEKGRRIFKSPPTDDELEKLIWTVWGGYEDSWKELNSNELSDYFLKRLEKCAYIDGIGYADIDEVTV